MASASPRRKEILGKFSSCFRVCPALGDETGAESLSPHDTVLFLAKKKAQEVFEREKGKDACVLGADTVVALGQKILGKPKTEREAEEMLSALSGRAHDVFTGVCVIYFDGKSVVERADVVQTKVWFRSLQKEEIERYVKSGSPMDKAGAYGIQDSGFVERIDGSYSCVVGLPEEWIEKTLPWERLGEKNK